ncbi:DUF1217 domain-containing protein [Caldovatus aquaticus]|uniref:DUF1217 domain-containing protein n=1 Tax=Caldovatus aquaticus TaxID=2865671 RepID=A0ABS7F498_9PROT|nr:DUF1217 domain-containing protein [Caldovatus aquaticus]MBW8270436.1 DUF1217 domain-containing protein [Caldovatus aquaticus]
MLGGLGAVAAWAAVQRQGEELQARFAARRDVAQDMARFRERAARIGSVDELLRDRRTLQVVLEAFQLESEIGKGAVLRRLLTDDPGDERSFANRMVDRRYREINAAFGGRAGRPLGDPALVERIVRLATANRFEKAMGEDNPGLREALYFQRRIGAIGSVTELMSDRALTAVARGGLGLPPQFALLSFERQKALLTQRLAPAEFKDPKAMARLAQRYLLHADTPGGGASVPPLLAFGGRDGMARLAVPAGARLSFVA